MNQEKIGRFISKLRKEKNMTQEQLAEKLGITNKSVSRWENGKTMPDLSIFKQLCETLDISINELMSGERIKDEEYSEKLEENFINTIDYINKKNINNNNTKSFVLLILGIFLIFASQFIFNRHEINEYINIVGLILVIYSIKRLFMKYTCFRIVVASILIIIFFVIVIIN